MLDRDGYGLLVDALREPGLRQRSRAYLRARLARQAGGEDAPRAVRIYALMGIAWMVLGALFVLVLAIALLRSPRGHLPAARRSCGACSAASR